MPKKFGINSKAAEARARVEEQKQSKRIQEIQAQEDAQWVDDDKSLAARQARQRAKEERKLQEQERKKEKKLLETAEAQANAKFAKKVRPEPKVTQAQIKAIPAIAKPTLSAAAPVFEPGLSAPLEEDINPNHAQREELARYAEIGAEVVSASNVDEALEELDDRGLERHPEKRMAKAWKDYLDFRFPQLKSENPTLKRSQLLELLQTEWKKAPENPMNKDHTTYNRKV